MARTKRAFDRDFYLQTYPDVAKAGVDPFRHYMETGWKEGRNPNKSFSTSEYLAGHPKLSGKEINPFFHFVSNSEIWSKRLGVKSLQKKWVHLQVKMAFDGDFYLNTNPDVAAAGVDPLLHYLDTGWREGRDPARWFSTTGYLQSYADANGAGENPFVHYFTKGKRKGMRPPASTRSNGSELVVDEVVPTPINADGILTSKPVRILAFYLPQFHPIPENDQWWGKGFTEWTNVRAAVPQFDGHYQPHVPGELGYYNLLSPGVQARQVELAKLYGIEGFCFYFYWFAGKRLLEAPLENWLNDKTLDLPFCLCWANENWTRRWDGQENEILIAQHHSASDDLAFIEAVGPYLRDPRYVRVNGKPLLIVYRPSLIPNMAETAARWRNWCRMNGIGELHLAYTQSFDEADPARYGLDAAVEFPPVRPQVTSVENGIRPIADKFAMRIFDWRQFKVRSESYTNPSYVLYRGVCTSWDNTARRKSAGTLFANSSPKLFEQWLANALRDTIARFQSNSERLVFVNAWNEWAEGAHLEPDQRYGYAWLQAVRDALQTVGKTRPRGVVIVTHDAHPHGAQYLSLHLAETIGKLGFSVDMIVLGSGNLMSRFAEVATVHAFDLKTAQPGSITRLLSSLADNGTSLALLNTTVSGVMMKPLKDAGFTTVCLVHELPGILQSYGLRHSAGLIADFADKVVFAAPQIQDGFEKFLGRSIEKSVIRPQGHYHHANFREGDRDGFRMTIRERHGLPVDAQIILSVGYGDRRKGFDLFVDTCNSVLRQNPRAYGIWVGHVEPALMEVAKQRIAKERHENRFVFTGFIDKPSTYYAAADIYALTSREDPFPSVVLESLEMGIPVVAFDGAGGIGELLARDSGVLVPLEDSSAMASAIAGLLDSPKEAERLGLNGRLIVKEEFDFRDYVFDLLSLGGIAIPKVSVVVPNYNYAHYLRERLQSIAWQTIRPYEIIVLDDASVDESLKVIEEFQSVSPIPVRVVTNTTNSGSVFRQWSKGVALARGDLIWIAEADDLCDPTMLEMLVPAFENPDVVMSYCQSKQIDENGHVLSDSYLDYVADVDDRHWRTSHVVDGCDEITLRLFVKNTIPNVSAVTFRRQMLLDVLREFGTEIESYRFAGDWVTYLRLLERGAVSFNSEALNLHRRHSNSVTLANHSLDLLREIVRVQRDTLHRFALGSAARERSDRYAQELFEQFGLGSTGIRSFDESLAQN